MSATAVTEPVTTGRRQRIAEIVIGLFTAFVFIQSLFFKFTNAAEPQHIFGTLNQWALDTFGIEGLFAPTGLFSQYVIGGAELVASILIIGGLLIGKPLIKLAGSALAVAIMSGAICFHLFTPLGVVIENPATGVENDHGALFTMAVLVWLGNLAMLWLGRNTILGLITRPAATA
jgi:hypothetical protein